MKKPLFLFIVLMIGVTFLIDDFRSAFAKEGDEEEFVLDEIVVTAQKREQSLHEVADLCFRNNFRSIGTAAGL